MYVWKMWHHENSYLISLDVVIASDRTCCDEVHTVIASLPPVVQQRANIFISIENPASVNTAQNRTKATENHGAGVRYLTATNTLTQNKTKATENHRADARHLTSINTHTEQTLSDGKCRVGTWPFTSTNTLTQSIHLLRTYQEVIRCASILWLSKKIEFINVTNRKSPTSFCRIVSWTLGSVTLRIHQCLGEQLGEFYMIVDTQHTIQQKDATCKYGGEFSIKDTELAPLSPLHDGRCGCLVVCSHRSTIHPEDCSRKFSCP